MHSFQKPSRNGVNSRGENEIGKFHEFYGKRLGRFLIEREIGDGGTGIVHRARDTLTGQPVAIKTASGRMMDLHRAESFLEREERALSLLNHPHIVKLVASGTQDGKGYIVTEYLDAPASAMWFLSQIRCHGTVQGRSFFNFATRSGQFTKKEWSTAM